MNSSYCILSSSFTDTSDSSASRHVLPSVVSKLSCSTFSHIFLAGVFVLTSLSSLLSKIPVHKDRLSTSLLSCSIAVPSGNGAPYPRPKSRCCVRDPSTHRWLPGHTAAPRSLRSDVQ